MQLIKRCRGVRPHSVTHPSAYFWSMYRRQKRWDSPVWLRARSAHKHKGWACNSKKMGLYQLGLCSAARNNPTHRDFLPEGLFLSDDETRGPAAWGQLGGPAAPLRYWPHLSTARPFLASAVGFSSFTAPLQEARAKGKGRTPALSIPPEHS